MIGMLEGKVVDKSTSSGYFILDVNGVGYLIYATAQVLLNSKIGDKLKIYTHLSVRETALDLYGFKDKNELRLFKLLIAISGVGPKSALSILSLADVHTIEQAVINRETNYLTKVSGIGPKLAQKIILELKDKIKTPELGDNQQNQDDVHVLEALEAMGYKNSDARKAVQNISSKTEGLNARLAEALKALSGK